MGAADRADLGGRIERHRRLSCRASRRRRTERGRPPRRPRSPRPARRAPSRTTRRGRRCGCGRCRCRRCGDPSRCSSAPATVAYATSLRRVAVGVDPSTGRPPAGRQDRDQRGLARRALDHAAARGARSTRKRSGSASSSCIQSSINVSTSVHAGDVIQLMPWTPSPAAASSPRIEAYVMLAGEVGEELRVLPVRQAGDDDVAQVVEHRSRTAPVRWAGAPAARHGPRRVVPATRPVVARRPRGTR